MRSSTLPTARTTWQQRLIFTRGEAGDTSVAPHQQCSVRKTNLDIKRKFNFKKQRYEILQNFFFLPPRNVGSVITLSGSRELWLSCRPVRERQVWRGDGEWDTLSQSQSAQTPGHLHISHGTQRPHQGPHRSSLSDSQHVSTLFHSYETVKSLIIPWIFDFPRHSQQLSHCQYMSLLSRAQSTVQTCGVWWPSQYSPPNNYC